MDKETPSNTEQKKKGFFRDTFDAIVVAFVVAMIIRTFIAEPFKIPSGSMLDTLQIGDHILVNKMSYLFSDPKHDDIIVFEYPLNPKLNYIKRVVGVPGDKIEIRDKIVYRNGERLNPDYVRYEYASSIPSSVSPRDNVSEFTVPKDCYLMMGDNRDASFDGRFWGFIQKKAVVGRAFMVYWSWGDSISDIRFNRIFKLL